MSPSLGGTEFAYRSAVVNELSTFLCGSNGANRAIARDRPQALDLDISVACFISKLNQHLGVEALNDDLSSAANSVATELLLYYNTRRPGVGA